MHQVPTGASILLRLPHVISRTGLPKSSIYMLMGQGKFPRPVKITSRAVAWPSSVVDEWIAERTVDPQQ
jgi:prophage regulatory protein